MTAETTQQRDAAFLRLYAEKVRAGTEVAWEIPNTRASTLEDIASRIVAPAWQPITTAPKDGTEILVRCQNRAGLPGTVVAHFCSWVEDHPPIAETFYFWDGVQFKEAVKPTHWMPLPDPPALNGAP